MAQDASRPGGRLVSEQPSPTVSSPCPTCCPSLRLVGVADVPVGDPGRARRGRPGDAHAVRASPTTSTARSPAASAWCPGSASCSTRSPTGSTSPRRCSAWPGATSSRGGWSWRWSAARCCSQRCCGGSSATARPGCRCTSSARRRRSTCSTPSRCCCSVTGTEHLRRVGAADRLGLRVVGDRPLLGRRGHVHRAGPPGGRRTTRGGPR